MRVRVRVWGEHRAQEKNRVSRVRLDERPEISVRTGTWGWVRAHEGAFGERTGLSGGLGSIKWEHREETRLHKGTRALSKKGGSGRRLWET